MILGTFVKDSFNETCPPCRERSRSSLLHQESQCPVCLQRQAPPTTERTSATQHPEQVGRLVVFDLGYKRDVNGQQRRSDEYP